MVYGYWNGMKKRNKQWKRSNGKSNEGSEKVKKMNEQQERNGQKSNERNDKVKRNNEQRISV